MGGRRKIVKKFHLRAYHWYLEGSNFVESETPGQAASNCQKSAQNSFFIMIYKAGIYLYIDKDRKMKLKKFIKTIYIYIVCI